jgi:hypothetical protein
MSSITHVLTDFGTPAFVLAAGRVVVQISRTILLHRAESAALSKGDEDPQGRAGLAIIESVNRREREPWYLAGLPWRRPDDGSGP